MEKHDGFIKISYCVFKMHKLLPKSSYEKDLQSVNTRKNVYICIQILNEPESSQ